MRAISPNTGAPEHVVAEDQTEYIPLSVAFYPHTDGTRSLVTAWVPTRAEREQMALALNSRLPALSQANADAVLDFLFRRFPVYVRQADFRQGMTPLMVSAGMEPWMATPEADAAQQLMLVEHPSAEPLLQLLAALVVDDRPPVDATGACWHCDAPLPDDGRHRTECPWRKARALAGMHATRGDWVARPAPVEGGVIGVAREVVAAQTPGDQRVATVRLGRALAAYDGAGAVRLEGGPDRSHLGGGDGDE
jgi:hypothetical protein